MQQIATSKSNIAALGVPAEQDILHSSSQVEEFRSLMRDQEKQLGYAAPVDPVGSGIQANGKKVQSDAAVAERSKAVTEEQPEPQDVSAQQEGATEQSLESDIRQPKDSEQQSSDEQQQLDSESHVSPDDKSAKGLNEGDDGRASDTPVDWLGLLEQANEKLLRVDVHQPEKGIQLDKKTLSGPGEEESQALSPEQLTSELSISVQTLLGERSEEQLQPPSLEEMLQLISESPEISETLSEQLKGMMAKLESSKSEQADEQFSDEELSNLQLIVDNLLALESEDGSAASEQPVDISLLVELLRGPADEQTGEPVVALQETAQNPLVDKQALSMLMEKSDLPSDVKSLLNLPEKKLDAVLSKLADELKLNQNLAEKQTQLAALEKQLNSTNDVPGNEAKTEFIATLKVGLEEIKSQLKQGHQPALDLKALVNDAVTKLTKRDQITDIPADKLDQVMTSLSRTLDAAQVLVAGHESQTVQATTYDRMINRESLQQATVEHNRQQQSSQLQDKGINITKPEGHQQMAEKVRWMVNSNNLQADIRLDPPELGSVKIRVNVSGEAASVSFIVQSQQARDVFEQATPRLKEMLEEQGIELGQSSVEQENGDQQMGEETELADGRGGQVEDEEEQPHVREQRVANGSLSGIDYYV